MVRYLDTSCRYFYVHSALTVRCTICGVHDSQHTSRQMFEKTFHPICKVIMVIKLLPLYPRTPEWFENHYRFSHSLSVLSIPHTTTPTLAISRRRRRRRRIPAPARTTTTSRTTHHSTIRRIPPMLWPLLRHLLLPFIRRRHAPALPSTSRW